MAFNEISIEAPKFYSPQRRPNNSDRELIVRISACYWLQLLRIVNPPLFQGSTPDNLASVLVRTLPLLSLNHSSQSIVTSSIVCISKTTVHLVFIRKYLDILVTCNIFSASRHSDQSSRFLLQNGMYTVHPSSGMNAATRDDSL